MPETPEQQTIDEALTFADKGSGQRVDEAESEQNAKQADGRVDQVASADRSAAARQDVPGRPDAPSVAVSPRRSGGGRARQKEAPRSTSVTDPGADLERRVARLEFAEGALARLRVPVRVEADPGRGVLTDLDVLAVDIDGRLRMTRSILECKSGKGQAGEPDRLLWLSGLRRLVSADRAVLVRQTATRRGRAVAAALDLQILDVLVLAEREAAHAWVPGSFGHIDGAACRAVEIRTDTQLKGLGHLASDLISFLRYDALTAASERTLSALEALGRAARSGGVLPEPACLVVAGHSLVALLLAGLQDAARLDTRTDEHLRRRVELSLTVGNPDDDHILHVLDRADQLVELQLTRLHEAYARAGSPHVEVQATSLRALVAAPPLWTDRYLDLVHRLRANASIAKDLARTAELACFDALAGDQNYTAAAFDHLFTIEHRHLLLVAVRLLHDIVGGQLADRLSPLLELDFQRSAPALPDRTATPGPST